MATWGNGDSGTIGARFDPLILIGRVVAEPDGFGNFSDYGDSGKQYRNRRQAILGCIGKWDIGGFSPVRLIAQEDIRWIIERVDSERVRQWGD